MSDVADNGIVPLETQNYILIRRLGEGWSGVAWHARLKVARFGLAAGHDVALKLYKAAIFSSAPNIRRRIKQEARLGQQLSHPNLLRVLALEDLSDAPGGPALALVMEFHAKGDLQHHLQTTPHLPGAELSRTAQGLADGLAYVHEQGVIHRDVKPQNILIANDGRPLLGDFGVMRVLRDETVTGSTEFLGTIRYTAPEVLKGAKPTAESDVYSLGTVFYQLLYGKPIQRGDILFTKLIIEIVSAEIEFPTGPNRFGSYPSAAHVVLEGVCRLMLDREPVKRLSAKAISQALQDGVRATTSRDALCKTVARLIRENAEKWFSLPRRPLTSFADYLASRVVRELDEANAIALLHDPRAGLIEENPRYLALATEPMPNATDYLKLPSEERANLLQILIQNRRKFTQYLGEGRESRSTSWAVFMDLIKHYLAVESDPDLCGLLQSIKPISLPE